RDPDVVAPDATERRPGEDADAGLVEQPLRELRAAQPRARDVRERVERAGWLQGADARDRVEAVDDQVAPGPELHDHRVDVVLRPAERLDRPDLGKRRGAADR